MIYIGIDPDTTATGIGIVVDPDTKAAGIGIVRATPYHYSCKAKGRFCKDRARGVLDEVGKALEPWAVHDDVTVAIEWQKIRAGEMAGKAQNIADVLGIAYGCLAIVTYLFPLATIHLPLPQDWKGTIPKNIHQNRVRKQLPAGLLLGLTATDASHVIDGLGLALWAQKKG